MHDYFRTRPLLLGLSALLLAAGLPAPIASAALAEPPQPQSKKTQPAPKAAEGALADRIADRVNREMNDYALVGVSVGIIKGGEVIFSGGWGWEDRDKHVPVSDVTSYSWASCSKTLTAALAMQLWSDGKLDLDRDVREYVPEWPLKKWQNADARITSRLLLEHQSGIPRSPGGVTKSVPPSQDTDHPYADVVAALRQFQDMPLKFKPGAVFGYSNGGYLLLAAAEQRAAGAPYEQLVHDRIAAHLGLSSLKPDFSWDPPAHRAKGYAAGGKKEALKLNSDTQFNLPACGWTSTVSDFARYTAAFLGERLVDEHMKRTMWVNQRTATGQTTPYGFGFFVGGRAYNHLVLTHSGGSSVASTYMVLVPSDKPGQGAGVVIMCNTSGARLGRLANDLLLMINVDGCYADQSEPFDD